MIIEVDETFILTPIKLSDKSAYLEHFQDKEIYKHTLTIPYPYTPQNADWWIQHVTQNTKKNGGRPTNWALRLKNNPSLIGGIGFANLNIGNQSTAELGYWLARTYWNQGLMTKTIQYITNYAFQNYELDLITAHVFHFNIRSCRVLEKNGFQFEKILPNHYKKDGHIFDGKLYTLSKPT